MRLTLDLIEHATSFTNPLGERELDLRGKDVHLLMMKPFYCLAVDLFRQQNSQHRKPGCHKGYA